MLKDAVPNYFAGIYIVYGYGINSLVDFSKSMDKSTIKNTITTEAYEMITDILHINNEFDDLPVRIRKKKRQAKLQEKVDASFELVKNSQITHNSVIGNTLAYNINQEKYFHVFLTDGIALPDNNYAEPSSRPFAIGRKNFFLTESDNGAKASAIFYSLVETA